MPPLLRSWVKYPICWIAKLTPLRRYSNAAAPQRGVPRLGLREFDQEDRQPLALVDLLAADPLHYFTSSISPGRQVLSNQAQAVHKGEGK